MSTKRLTRAPQSRPHLTDATASKTFGLTKERAERERPKLAAELAELQELMYAASRNSLLVILQGMDTSGKDGTIKHVMDPVNPVGVAVHSFKVLTTDDLAHDFIWRVHKLTPPRGLIGIFNRSHYEDVLVVRVHDLVPKRVWRRRYRHINDFERLLVDSDTIILKFFLHISRAEQEQRLLAREEEVEKAWKLSAGDWVERGRWNDYLEAYEDAIERTNTQHAPWFIVPADKKWSRNHLILMAIVDTLRPYRDGWLRALDTMGTERKLELAKYRESKHENGKATSDEPGR
jgi:PPK2 family polyphosphate:nucleotide phosphotransferase